MLHDWQGWLRSSSGGLDRDLIGYVAAALVLAAFMMRSMRPLRMTAILSNIAFIYYGCIADMRPILILHGILLPLNLIRLMQIRPSEYDGEPSQHSQSGCHVSIAARLVRLGRRVR